MSEELTEQQAMELALHRALAVISVTCAAQGQSELGMDLLSFAKQRDYRAIALTCETMAESVRDAFTEPSAVMN